ncbi:hypothetical protein [Streptomyces sp. Je 1-369]|uniref:hypothetical protein n=1 Tax=Streptomyces sp. Je 1-369 TaxID=2966192 RepID=UPI002286BF2C|nr:hypothetical protein [Streptomyces sp. Je 1-369]WAL93851.1 hypothetical protein NOO62_04695 [Streptomyces sp. Je 1-369]
MAPKADPTAHVDPQWWGFEIHLSHEAVELLDQVDGIIQDIVAEIPEIGEILEAALKLQVLLTYAVHLHDPPAPARFVLLALQLLLGLQRSHTTRPRGAVLGPRSGVDDAHQDLGSSGSRRCGPVSG